MSIPKEIIERVAVEELKEAERGHKLALRLGVPGALFRGRKSAVRDFVKKLEQKSGVELNAPLDINDDNS